MLTRLWENSRHDVAHAAAYSSGGSTHVEHHVRVEFDGGSARHQTQGEAGDNEDDGIGRVKSPRQQRKRDHEEQEDEEDCACALYTGGHAPTVTVTHAIPLIVPREG